VKSWRVINKQGRLRLAFTKTKRTHQIVSLLFKNRERE
jgi:hypothetical protein